MGLQRLHQRCARILTEIDSRILQGRIQDMLQRTKQKYKKRAAARKSVNAHG